MGSDRPDMLCGIGELAPLFKTSSEDPDTPVTPLRGAVVGFTTSTHWRGGIYPGPGKSQPHLQKEQSQYGMRC